MKATKLICGFFRSITAMLSGDPTHAHPMIDACARVTCPLRRDGLTDAHALDQSKYLDFGTQIISSNSNNNSRSTGSRHNQNPQAKPLSNR